MSKIVKTVLTIAVAVAVIVFAPQIAAVLASVAGSIGVTVTAAALTSALVGMGLSLALTAAMSVFRKAPSMSQSLVDRLNTSVVPTAARKIIFGTTAGGQDVRFFESDFDLKDTKKDGYVQVIALASHRITAFKQFYVENDLVYSNGAWLKKRDGFAPQNPLRIVTEGKPGNGFAVGSGSYWRSTASFTGCAYYVPTWKLDSEIWESGIPQRLTAVVDGCPVYDPRRDSTRGGSGSHRYDNQDTWTFADGAATLGRNPALALLTYLIGWRINGKVVWGMGLPANRIDLDNFRTYANVCEEGVATAAGGTVQRYTHDGIYSTSDSHDTVINAITAAMGSCKLTDRGGTYCLVGGYDDTAGPKVEFTADDLVAPANGSSPDIGNPAPASRERFNIVRGRFANPEELFQLTDWGDPIEQPALADGIPRTLTLDLGGVSRAETCQRIAKQFLLREYLTPGMFSATFGPKAFAVEVGSVITLSLPSEGWNSKLFRVMEQAESHDMFFTMTLREEDPAIYAWDREEKPLPASIRPQGYDASLTIAPEGLALNSASYAGANGINVSEVYVKWVPENSGRVTGIQIQSRPEGSEGWTEQAAIFDPKAGTFTFTSNAPGITVEVRARYRMMSAVYSAWVQASIGTAPVLISYDDVDGTPGNLSDINPDEGGKLGGIQPGATVGGTIGQNIKNPDGSIYKPPLADQLVDNTPPGAVTNLALSSVITDAGVDLTATWIGPSDKDLAGYDVAIREGGGSEIVPSTTGTTYKWHALKRNTNYTAKVRAYDKAGNRGPYTNEQTVTTVKDTVAPAAVTAIATDTTYNSAFITWMNPADADLQSVRLELKTVAGVAVQAITVNAVPATVGSMAFTTLDSATSYIATLYALDTSGNASPSATSATFTTAGGIAAADLTPGLTAPAYGSTLPSAVGYTGPALFFNTSDGRLYRYAAGAWSTSVDGDDVASTDNALVNADYSMGASHWSFTFGNATAARCAALAGDPANYVRVTSTSVADAGNGYVFSDRTPIPAGATKLFGSYWKRSSLAGQQVAFDVYFYDAAGAQVGYGRFSSFTGAANTWTQVTQDLNGSPIMFIVPAGAATFAVGPVVVVSPDATQDITLIRMSGTQLGATVGAPAGTLVGGTDASALEARANDPAARVNAMTTTINGGKITTGSITALQIQAATITGDKIVAGAITTALLAAGAITASKLAVSGSANLVRDPNFQDPFYWTNSGVVVGPMPFKVNAPGWYYGVDANGQNATNLADFVTLWSGNQNYGTGAQFLTSGVTPIQAGTVYELSAVVANASNQTIRVSVTTTANNGNTQDFSLAWDAGTTSRKSLQFTTTGVVSAAIKIYNNGAPQAAFSGVVRAGGFSLQQAVGATLIQNGAITTDKLVAGAVTADKILAGSISSAHFSTTAALPGTITIGGTGVQVGTVNRLVQDGLVYTDTRNDNQPPSYYYAKGMVTVAEFKAASTIGIVTGGYCQMVTTVQWGDASGGPVQQEVRDAYGAYWNRVSLTTSSWGPWKDTGGQINAGTTQIDPGKITIAGNTTLASWRGGGDNTQINGGAIAANTILTNSLKVGARGISTQDLVFEYRNGGCYWGSGAIFYTDDTNNRQVVGIAAGSCGAPPSGNYYYIYWPKGIGSLSVTVDWGTATGPDSVHIATFTGSANINQLYGGTIINGTQISTGSITADRLNVGSLSAITANIGLLRTAASGQRMELDSNSLRAYDNNGTLRVRVGIW